MRRDPPSSLVLHFSEAVSLAHFRTQAYLNATKENFVGMHSVSTAVKFAGMNNTPSQSTSEPRPPKNPKTLTSEDEDQV